jgi:hypothetical protein
MHRRLDASSRLSQLSEPAAGRALTWINLITWILDREARTHKDALGFCVEIDRRPATEMFATELRASPKLAVTESGVEVAHRINARKLDGRGRTRA